MSHALRLVMYVSSLDALRKDSRIHSMFVIV